MGGVAIDTRRVAGDRLLFLDLVGGGVIIVFDPPTSLESLRTELFRPPLLMLDVEERRVLGGDAGDL